MATAFQPAASPRLCGARAALSPLPSLLVVALALALPCGVVAAPPAAPHASPTSAPLGSSHEDFQLPPPPFTEGLFPCSECHKDLKPNLTPRKLVDMHDDIVLNHGDRDRWCFDCHDPDNRDKLRLASGRLIDFSQSYLLCGQCHGDKLRDWKVGVHGKRIGHWNGPKQYFLCVNCHNPHSPHFKPLKPLPPPIPPSEIRLTEGGKP